MIEKKNYQNKVRGKKKLTKKMNEKIDLFVKIYFHHFHAQKQFWQKISKHHILHTNQFCFEGIQT